MFDLGRITDMLGGLVGGSVQEIIERGNILETLQSSGLDPSLLQGLDHTQVLEFLQQHGIDVSALGETDLAALLQQIGGADGPGLGSWTDGPGERGS